MPCKLYEWYAKQEVRPCATHKWEVGPWGLCGHPKKYINLGRFQRRQNKAEKQSIFTEKSHRHPCVCAFQPSLTLSTLPIRQFRVIKKRKEADYIFIHHCCLLCYIYIYIYTWKRNRIVNIVYRPLTEPSGIFTQDQRCQQEDSLSRLTSGSRSHESWTGRMHRHYEIIYTWVHMSDGLSWSVSQSIG